MPRRRRRGPRRELEDAAGVGLGWVDDRGHPRVRPAPARRVAHGIVGLADQRAHRGGTVPSIPTRVFGSARPRRSAAGATTTRCTVRQAIPCSAAAAQTALFVLMTAAMALARSRPVTRDRRGRCRSLRERAPRKGIFEAAVA